MSKDIYIPFPAQFALQKLGKDINNARRRRRISKSMMAERAGIAINTLSKIEAGNPNTTMAEALALSLAQKAGIQVPRWRIVKAGDKPILIVQRFDRQGKQRIPFLSAMSMLGGADNEQHSYLEIAHAIIRHGTEPERDLKELWKRMIFNISISNIDDHLRNHGFLLRTLKGWELSPAYDLNPVSRQVNSNYHALAINQTSTEGSIETAFSIMEEFRINKNTASSILADVQSSVSEWQNTARSLGISKQEINSMKSAFLP
jgi:serine/threonine-protein kinase HipA